MVLEQVVVWHVPIPSVEYLGHQIDEEGIRAVPNKVEAITNAPQPTNVQELHSFLGLLNYYGKFIRNLSSIIHLLNGLLMPIKSGNGLMNAHRHLRNPKDN